MSADPEGTLNKWRPMLFIEKNSLAESTSVSVKFCKNYASLILMWSAKSFTGFFYDLNETNVAKLSIDNAG